MDGPSSDVTRAYQQFVVHQAVDSPLAETLAATHSESASAIGEPRDFSVTAELEAMEAALRRSQPIRDAPLRIVRVITRQVDGALAVDFCSRAPLVAEITLEALADIDRVVTGIQVRDADDRMLWTTRLDWQKAALPSLKRGQRATVAYSTPRLLLGAGQYQLTVACHQYPRDDRVFHWIDGAWRFTVSGPNSDTFSGPLDLDWRVAS